MAIAAGGRLFAPPIAVSGRKALSHRGHARCGCLSPMPTPSAHDRLFRCVFAEPEHAAGLLRSVLPGEISAQIEWSSLETVPGSVIDPELREVCVDLLFRVKLDRREAYVYVLLEHQSTSDRTMPFRMLRYMVRIWHKHKALPLPPIIPIIVHHSERGWTAPLTLGEMVDAPPELLRFVPAFELVLDDLSAARDEDLRRRTLTDFAALTLFCLARGRLSPDFLGELGRWVRTLPPCLRRRTA